MKGNLAYQMKKTRALVIISCKRVPPFVFPRFGLTAVYLLVIQYFTRMGGKVAVKLIKYEKFDTAENKANSLVYKVDRKTNTIFVV